MHIHHEIIKPNYTIAKLSREWGFDHWHQKVEFAYILEGVCEIKVGNEDRVCRAGDLAVIHSGEIHSIRDLDNSSMYICTFDPEMLYYFRSDMGLISNFVPADRLLQVGIGDEVRRAFEEIFRENTANRAWNDVLIRSDILRIYSLLLRHFPRAERAKQQNLEKLQLFQEALMYIEDHYAENITLSDMAGVISYNASYVSSLFVAYTGQNFKTYLDSFRINKAVKLLKRTERTVADISAQCGFTNIRTFNNVFRKVTGMTPTQLRGQ